VERGYPKGKTKTRIIKIILERCKKTRPSGKIGKMELKRGKRYKDRNRSTVRQWVVHRKKKTKSAKLLGKEEKPKNGQNLRRSRQNQRTFKMGN